MHGDRRAWFKWLPIPSIALFTIAMFELEPNSLLKHISSRCFQDYNLNPWVRGFVYVFAILYLFFLAINF